MKHLYLTIALLAIVLTFSSVSMAEEKVTVILDHETMAFKQNAIEVDGVVYLPMLEFGDAMEISTVSSTTAKENLPYVGYMMPINQDIRFTVGGNTVWVQYSLIDTKDLILDKPYPVIEGTAMVPIDILKTFDIFKQYDITYDTTANALHITDKSYKYMPQPQISKTGYVSLLWGGKSKNFLKDRLEKEIKALAIDRMAADEIRFGYMAEDDDNIYYVTSSPHTGLGIDGFNVLKKDSRADKRQVDQYKDLDIFMPVEENGKLKGFLGQKNFSEYESKPIILSSDLKSYKAFDVPFKYIHSFHVIDKNRVLVGSFEGWDKTAKLYLYLLTIKGDSVECSRLAEASEFVFAKGNVYFIKEWRGSTVPYGILYKATLSGDKLINQKAVTSFKVWNLHADQGELYYQKNVSTQLYKGENTKAPVHVGASKNPIVAYGGAYYSSKVIDDYSGTHRVVKYTPSSKKKVTGPNTDGYLDGVMKGSFADLLKVYVVQYGIEHKKAPLCLPVLKLDVTDPPMAPKDFTTHPKEIILK